MNFDKEKIARGLCNKALQTYYNTNESFVSDTLCSSINVHKKLSVRDVCNGVVLFTIFEGMSAGSAGSIQLYRLMQAYLLDPEKRKEINNLL